MFCQRFLNEIVKIDFFISKIQGFYNKKVHKISDYLF